MQKIVDSELAGKRADQVVAILAGISRSKAAALCAQKLIRVNGIPVGKSQILAEGDDMLIELSAEPEVPVEPAIDLPILYQDQ